MNMWQIINQLLAVIVILVVAAVSLIGLDYYKLAHVQHHWCPRLTHYETAPTLFTHGYRGNRYSMGHLLMRLQKTGVAKKALVIKVAADGTLTFKGPQELTASNPTIQVLFQNNHADVQDQVRWLSQIVAILKKDYDVTTINLVGHSMGAITVLRYLLKPTAVPVKAVVLLAAPVNDPSIGPDTATVFWSELTQRGPRKKTANYNYLAKRVAHFPTAISILNVAGELLGTSRHDGSVAVDSSFALRSLLRGRIDRYQEMLVRGAGGAHSMLHENRLVDQAISDFLWQD